MRSTTRRNSGRAGVYTPLRNVVLSKVVEGIAKPNVCYEGSGRGR